MDGPLIDEDRTVEITIDPQRIINLTPTTDGKGIVLTVEDPHSVCVVGMTMADVDVLVEALQRLSHG